MTAILSYRHGIIFKGASSSGGGVSANVQTLERATDALGQPDFASNQANWGFRQPSSGTLDQLLLSRG